MLVAVILPATRFTHVAEWFFDQHAQNFDQHTQNFAMSESFATLDFFITILALLASLFLKLISFICHNKSQVERPKL